MEATITRVDAMAQTIRDGLAVGELSRTELESLLEQLDLLLDPVFLEHGFDTLDIERSWWRDAIRIVLAEMAQ